MKQIYKITYPTGKIYVEKDSFGSARYYGSPDMGLINSDFEKLPKEQRLDYMIRKQILWESETATEAELSAKEVEMIWQHRSNDPEIGYNQWPKRKWRGGARSSNSPSSDGDQGEVAPFVRVIRSMSKLGPAALHVNCGIRGQDLRLVVTNNTTVSLGVVHVCGSTLSRPSMVSAELIPLRILLPCGIICADLASC